MSSSWVHPALDRLVAMIDDELPEAARQGLRAHLQLCPDCKRQVALLTTTSRELEKFFAQSVPVFEAGARVALLARLDHAPASTPVGQRSHDVRGMRSLPTWLTRGFVAAVAASLVVALWLRTEPAGKQELTGPASNWSSDRALLEVDGETFLPLPYSNRDLPMGAPHVLRMHVPITSLAEAGLSFQPDPGTTADRGVLADVLLGVDGEPLGVHVLER